MNCISQTLSVAAFAAAVCAASFRSAAGSVPPDGGWSAGFLENLATNFDTAVQLEQGTLLRCENTEGQTLDMVLGGDLLFKLTRADGSYDWIHVFTNTTQEGMFYLKPGFGIKEASVMILGGGGAGGAAGGYSGGGGGGGAGGLLLLDGVRIVAGRYRVAVGAGGIGYKSEAGRNGGASRIWSDSVELWTALEAGGGGGGGSVSVGKDGGSGGGGSISNAGGSSSFEEQGHDGGYGGALSGGGGGGAGAVGSSGNDAVGGKGGMGTPVAILGFSQYVGGGGGGGGKDANGGGGGGTGGGASAGTTLADRGKSGRPGVNGLGGGGAGTIGDSAGGSKPAGGTGGSGLVVIRYTGDPKRAGLVVRIQ